MRGMRGETLTMHAPILASEGFAPVIEAQWASESACCEWATRLAACLRPTLEQGGSVDVSLDGPLGAGKTTFTRHLLRALGVAGRIKSPSYAVVETHELPGFAVHHFDFYRFNDPQEWEDAGFRDLFASPGLRLTEWPDKAAGLLPTPDLKIEIEPVSDTGRRVRLHGLSRAAAPWLEAMAQPAQPLGEPA
jgi:tRNA threonylcarbamoyladenosine biosynthesis protein TsaE